MLSSFGAGVIEMASTAEDALSKCNYEQFNVIVCDYNLGEGKNGQQILEELRIKGRIKHTDLFIMVTAETSKEIVMGAREYRPDAYIAKPVTRAVLQKRLDDMLIQKESLKAINRELDLENHQKAIQLCHGELQKNNRYKMWCLQTLAQLYLQTGDHASAANIYQDVLSKRELTWARMGLGETLLAQQHYEAAKDCFKQVIEANPDLVEAYDGISESCDKLGQTSESQRALKQAVEISPRLVPRQEKLGKLCKKNQDIEGATAAYRAAVQYGENSVHEKAENYLNLGRCLSDLSEGDHSEKGQRYAKEACDTLYKASFNFPTDEDTCINALLIESRVHAGQNRKEESEKVLQCAEDLVDEENLSSAVGIELARTLYTVGDHGRAEKLLFELAEKYSDDPSVISEIEALIDEPVGMEAKLKARELNKAGIKLFEQGKLPQAVDTFHQALEYTPKHPALNLNLIQVLLKLIEQNGFDADSIKIGQECLENIKHIPQQHRQYRRMKHLEKKIMKLTQTESNP